MPPTLLQDMYKIRGRAQFDMFRVLAAKLGEWITYDEIGHVMYNDITLYSTIRQTKKRLLEQLAALNLPYNVESARGRSVLRLVPSPGTSPFMYITEPPY